MLGYLKICTAAALLLSFGASGPEAQSLRRIKGPAEVPPASFTGKQYVDSRGCVFIRAGYGERVTWVPRVNRKRQVYCSRQNRPSLSASQLAALGSSTSGASGAPVARAPAAKAPPAGGQAAAVRTARKTAPRPQPRATALRKGPATPPATTSANAAAATSATTKTLRSGRPQAVHPGDLVGSRRDAALTTARSSGATATTRAQGAAARRVAAGRPQAVHPGDLLRQRRLAAARAANASAHVGPQAETPLARDPIHRLTTAGVTLDPDVTVEGDRQMQRIWTNTVPRRLIDQDLRVRGRAAPATGGLRISSKTP